MDEQDGPDGPRARYADLVMELAGEAGVTVPQGGSGFGRSALRFRGKIFAMLVRGRLVLKLPATGSRRWSRPGRATTSTRTRARR